MNQRIRNILAKLKEKNLDCLLVSSEANISYLAKFRSRDSYLLVSKKGNIYFTDCRYTQEAKFNLKGAAEIKKINGSSMALIADTCHSLRVEKIGIEEEHFSFAAYKKLRRCLKSKGNLVSASGAIEELRQIKDNEEIKKIREAIRITRSALKFIKSFIKAGRKEIEVAAELERFIRYQGASSAAFDIIVASGPNSSLPHHITGERKLMKNEPVLVDIGVDYFGYKSDLTRVFFLGKINILAQEVGEILLEAQARAIKRIKPGVCAKEIDAASRDYIIQQGYGEYFGHALGHGIGLEVHEAPRISGKERVSLASGMVFTIEPAIYLPGKFGIRLEDNILVTKKGCEVLSGAIN